MGSALLFLLATPWLIWDIVRVYRLEKADRAQANLFIFSVFYSSVLVMLGLQLANSLVIADAWPLFLALVLTVAGAFQQFVLLVRTQQIENRQDSETDPR